MSKAISITLGTSIATVSRDYRKTAIYLVLYYHFYDRAFIPNILDTSVSHPVTQRRAWDGYPIRARHPVHYSEYYECFFIAD